jgi:hypothetical protein
MKNQMNNGRFPRQAGIWLVGRRVHDRLWELTHSTTSDDQTDSSPTPTIQALPLWEYLAKHDVRLLFNRDTFMETFDDRDEFIETFGDLPRKNRTLAAVLILDADMLGERRLELLHISRCTNPGLTVILYMATDQTTLVRQTDDLSFSGYITRQDSGEEWIRLFQELGRTGPFYSTEWRNLFRKVEPVSADNDPSVYPLADWVGPPIVDRNYEPVHQKVDFSIN